MKLAISLIIIVLIGIYLVTSWNRFKRLSILVDEAFATMDIYLKKRWDLVPNMVNVVKGYTKHELEVFTEAIKLRSEAYSKMNMNEKIGLESKLSAAIPSIYALSEAYPDLKSNENFIELSRSLTRIEEDISQSRKYYNGAVKKYNTAVSLFPGNIVAGMFNFSTRPLYEISEGEREVVNVSFE
ncbi:MAG: LemA family protein [Gudongella sp.]|jgi:LemA protein|nr:LemA family protein [Gudongella sp.]